MLLDQTILSLFHTMGYLALIAIAFGAVERARWPWLARSLVQGVVFGGGAVLAMFDPARLGDGIQIDGRAMIVGFAAAFAGWPAALIAGAMAAGYRIVLGGIGTVPGVTGIVIAMCVGLAWRHWLRPRGEVHVLDLLGLGILISCHLLPSVLLGYSVLIAMAVNIAPYVVSASVVASLMLGLFIERELRQIAREQHWKQNALTDPLTGLPNRRAFERGMQGLRIPERDAALLIVDLDHFKRVNDNHGHAAGDYVLQRTASVLRSGVRIHDLVARLGGEELAVLLPNTGVAEAAVVADRLRSSVESLDLAWLGRSVPITISIGVVVAKGTLPEAAMLAQADAALYAAKRSGRNRVVFSGEVLMPTQDNSQEIPEPAVSDRRTGSHRAA